MSEQQKWFEAAKELQKELKAMKESMIVYKTKHTEYKLKASPELQSKLAKYQVEALALLLKWFREDGMPWAESSGFDVCFFCEGDRPDHYPDCPFVEMHGVDSSHDSRNQ